MAAPSPGRLRLCVLGLLLSWSNVCMGTLCNTTSVPTEMDKASVSIVSHVEEKISILTRTTECRNCVLETVAVIGSNSNCTISVDTRWPMRYEVKDDSGKQEDSCSEQKFSFAEYGIYTIYIKYNNSRDKNQILCDRVLMNMPVDSNRPIYIATGVFVGAALLWIFIINCHRRHWFNKVLLKSGAERLIVDPSQNETQKLAAISLEGKHTTLRKRKGLRNQKQSTATKTVNVYTSQDLGSMTNMQTNINPVDNEESKPKKERLKSLDTFRGMSLVVMCFVNYGGGGYWFFAHSDWNGLTVADLVFPWFIFMMGTSMAFSYSTLLRKDTPKYQIFLKIFKRSCILFVLGLVVNTSSNQSPVELTKLRIPGVLQRFAGTYLIIATLHLLFVKVQNGNTNSQSHWNKVRDIIEYWPEWLFNFGLIGIHLGLTFGLFVPGCPKGYLGPGGDADNRTDRNCTGGAAGYIDRVILGNSHIYSSPTCKRIYNTTVHYDPEGLLGTLTSCFICFLGLQAGKILMYFKEPRGRIIRFLIWGFVLCLIAGILCKFSKDGGWIPINKNLWSLSFVMCMSGMGFIVLTLCYLTIDVWDIWNGAPFYYPGMNPIVLYVGHEILHKAFPVRWAAAMTHGSQLPVALWGTFFWIMISLFMYWKNMFISI